MSSHWDNNVDDEDMDSSAIDEDSSTEEEQSQGGKRKAPPPRARPLEEATTPKKTRFQAGKGVVQGRPTPLQSLPPEPAHAAKAAPGGVRHQPGREGDPDRKRDSVVLSRGRTGIQKWVVVILVVALCASLCHSVAFASGGWMQNGNTHIGLWMDCNCTTYTPDADSAKWLISSKVFLGIALIVSVGMALTVPVYTALESSSRKKTLAGLFYRCADLTLALTLTGCLPAGFLFDIKYNLGVGFSLCVVAALLCIPKHVLLVVRNQDNFLYKFNWPHTAITLFYLITVHFIVVCYASSSWASTGDKHTIGLWLNCTCGGTTFEDNERDNTFKAVQAMITVGEILLVVNVFIIAVLAGLPMTNTRRTTLITAIYIISFAAGITTVIADVMFATSIVKGYSVGLSFIFSILSAVCCIVASCIAVLRRSSARSQTRPMSSA